MNFLGNLLWLVLGGLLVALLYFAAGLLLCITIVGLVCGLVFCITFVGIPWGIQHFRMALNSIFPFGKEIR